MWSSTASNTSLLIPVDTTSFLRHRLRIPIFTSPRSLIFSVRPKTHRFLRLSASLAEESSNNFSWLPPDPNSPGNKHGGWEIVVSPPQDQREKTGLNTILIGAVGSSLAVLVATIAYFSIARKGFNFQLKSPLHASHEVLNWNENIDDESENVESILSEEDMVYESGPELIPDSTTEAAPSASIQNFERLIVSVAIDSTQQEALSVLMKLKIIEDDVKGEKMCTRREYATWLVRVNSLLERNPKQRIVPSISLSGSGIAAFDDVGLEDPDFESIQALAEAGIIPSKLSGKSSSSSGLENVEGINFFPERFLSREDLLNWKAQVEYEVKPEIIEEITNTKVDYMDMKEISPDASPELFIDLLAGDNSIARKVFGRSKRLQPNKPSTRAQAAVALTSGRMTEAISTELLRLEAESNLRQAVMEEIRTHLLEKGDIQRYWDEKLQNEKIHGFEVEHHYLAAVHELEEERIVQEKCFANHLKEKAAMDCQRQLLSNLKEEVDDISQRLVSERPMYVAEQLKLQGLLNKLQSKHEELLDTRSILEAEIEALRILKSWIEDEARKSQARAKVLEDVGRRWKWEDQD